MRQLTRPEAAARAALLTVDRYDVTLNVTRGADVFGSTTRIRFSCAEPGSSSFAELLAAHVESITLNGRPLDVADALAGHRIRLDGLGADNELVVVADCAYSRSGEGLHRFVDPADGEVYLYSQTFLYDAQQLFACFDQPDLKARFALTVHAPAEWEVVANAAPVAAHVGGAGGGPGAVDADTGAVRTHVFADTPPLSTYLFAVAAGRYAVAREEHDGIALGAYCRRSLARHLDADEIFTVTKASFDYYHRHFGLRYPLPKYDQLFVPEFNAGAMENLGAVTFNESFVFRSQVTESERLTRASVIAHEMAHMWFGDIVTMRWWGDLWLNESFATYMAPAVLTAATRFTNAWTHFATSDKTRGYRADQQPTTHPISTDVGDTDAALTNFDGISYGKGAGVLRQLVAWVGEDAFYAGLRSYFARHAYANASLDDLLGELSAASGRDLRRWADQWVGSAGVNTLGYDAHAAVVVQTAPADHPTLRDHRIRVGRYDLTGGVLRRRDQVELDVAGARTSVPELADGRPAHLVLVNDDDLTYTRTAFDECSLRTVLAHVGALPDPLARAVCWAALWELARDAALPAAEYVDAVVRGARGESEVATLGGLLANAQHAVDRYLPPAASPAAADCLAAELLDLAGQPDVESSRQLALVRGFAATARSAEHLAVVAGWLAGSGVPAGLVVDTDLRWQLLVRLAARGAAGETAVADELRRDDTSSGRRWAATAHAALPTPGAKARVWADVIASDALSNDMVRGNVDGFWQPGQDDVCRPYADRYFAGVPGLWASRPVEIATEISRGLYPWTLIEQATVDRTDVVLAGDLPHALRRVLLEQRAEVVRALSARAAVAG
ncbi:MAG TPA: aminopeptidase N [Mycobacteriales bacterium]|nr:aminopeptidase N [Mycobacteriales bacterium]